MNELEIIRSSTRTPSTLVSSGLHPATITSVLKTAPEEVLTTVVTAITMRVSLDRSASSRMLSTGPRRSRWARVQDALSVEGVAATREASLKPPGAAPKADDLVEATNGDGLADATPTHPLIEPNSATARVELTIDSLRNYELVRPIPVFVEALGERHYVAEVPDLNITTSASSLSEILIVLKDSVTQTYDRLRIRRNLDPEQARQLKMLETYVGKSKRSWLDRR
jgi:hypothetical protein